MKRAGLIVLLVVVVALIAWWTHRPPEEAAEPARGPRSAEIARLPSLARAPVTATVPRRLDGLVLGLDGAPIASAVVVLESTPPRTTKTGADGSFSFAPLEPHTYAIFATSGELALGPIDYDPAVLQQPLILRLTRGVFVVVTVVDDAALPIARAQIQLEGRPSTEVQTDDAGKASFGPLEAGYLGIHVAAAGYVPRYARLVLGTSGSPSETTVVLARGVSVSGRVVDPQQRSVAGAQVSLAYGDYGADAGVDPVRSNEQGAFVFDAVAPGQYRLQAVDELHACARSATFEVSDVPTPGHELVLGGGGVITGRVVDEQGASVPFAKVSPATWTGFPRAVTADAEGAFELRVVVGDRTSLFAELATRRSKRVDVLGSELPRRDVELVLESGGTIAGTVVDERGAALAGVWVQAEADYLHLPPGYRGWAPAREVLTDRGGAFVLRDLDPVLYHVAATRRPPRGMMTSQRRTTANVGDEHVQLELEADGQLAGRLVVEGVAAPQHVTVWVDNQLGAQARPDGSFLLEGIAPGTYHVRISGDDFRGLDPSEIVIRPGATTDLGSMSVPRSRVLTGRIVDPSGHPLGGAQIVVGVIRPFTIDEDGRLSGGFHGYYEGVAGRDGSFRVIQLPPNEMIALASKPGYGLSPATLVAGAAQVAGDPPPVTLVLSPLRGAR